MGTVNGNVWVAESVSFTETCTDQRMEESVGTKVKEKSRNLEKQSSDLLLVSATAESRALKIDVFSTVNVTGMWLVADEGS